MPVRMINDGLVAWYARKWFPALAGDAYLRLQYIKQHMASRRYIDYFLSQKEAPLPIYVNIETYNRCNNTCKFCPANRIDESRPEKLMDESLFHSIIKQTKEMGFKGRVALFLNNEPLLDERIYEFCEYVKQELPDNTLYLCTNGILLTEERLRNLAQHVDILTINNYSGKRKIHKHIQKLINDVNARPELYHNIDIVVSMRYVNEVLSNRAGMAPNKNSVKASFNPLCLFPYTDLTVYPDGKVGLCCSDATEVTCLGELTSSSILEVWNGKKFSALRKTLASGRNGYPFCSKCDFVDTGHRITQVKKTLKAR